MSTCRIALATLRYPATPDEAVAKVRAAIGEAAAQRADVACFPEGYVPGYRGLGFAPPPPDPAFLDRAWRAIADAAGSARVAVVLGTERVVDGHPVLSAFVVDRDGATLGFQDKTQIDPSEEGIYERAASPARRVFTAAGVTFGVVICHEGWRYPETVRWAARHGAQVVFHPHLSVAEPGAHVPSTFGEPAGSFHEKAALCRAAENTCYFATVNYASAGAPTASAIARPDGTLLAYQPYDVEGVLAADVDLAAATGLLAKRYRAIEPPG